MLSEDDEEADEDHQNDEEIVHVESHQHLHPSHASASQLTTRQRQHQQQQLRDFISGGENDSAAAAVARLYRNSSTSPAPVASAAGAMDTSGTHLNLIDSPVLEPRSPAMDEYLRNRLREAEEKISSMVATHQDEVLFSLSLSLSPSSPRF